MTDDDVSSTAETQRVPVASPEMDTAAEPKNRNFAGTAAGIGRKIAFPALFLVIGGVVALLGERLIDALFVTENETRVQAFEDWRLVCPPAVVPPAPPPPPPPAEGETAPPAPPVPTEIPPCALTIEVVNNAGALVALAMNDPSSRIVVTVPHGVALEPGLGFAVGTEAMRIHPYETCTAVGCVAHVPADAETLRLMQESTGGEITVVPRNVAQPEPVKIPFSLNGFAEGHAALAREAARRSSVWRFLSR
jgi:invasion protein IalB